MFWQMEDSEGTVKQIGVFSEEINNLTVSNGHSSIRSCCEYVLRTLSRESLKNDGLRFCMRVSEHAEGG